MLIIFNTWNACVGCGTVTLPWAFQQSGILVGVSLTALTCALAFSTQILILRTAGSELDYATIAYKHYQKSGWVFS